MSILGIDIGSSTTKIIEYKYNKILNKQIFENKEPENCLREFIVQNETEKIEKVVVTGIGAKKINKQNFSMPVEIVEEFKAIGKGGLALANKERAIVISIGTGTAFVRAEWNNMKHLGGTGIGAGTLTNLCNKFINIKDFKKISDLSLKGNLENIDLRIGDITEEEIKTLPKELTLSNFGKISEIASKEDMILGIINMIFETIGMMAAFASINDNIKDIVLLGNIVKIPVIKESLRKIEITHKVNFIIPDNAEYGVVYGAIKSCNI